MKRYTYKQTVTEFVDHMRFGRDVKSVAHMIEDDGGEWVRVEDALAAIKELGPKLPESRMDRMERALGLFEEGRCPECERPIKGWEAPCGSFAPEQWATLKERGVDPHTGHKITCSRAHT